MHIAEMQLAVMHLADMHLADMHLADMQQAQLLMVAGFVMLGWVLVRRQIRGRRGVDENVRSANKAIEEIRNYRDPSVPLSNAPPETQRWQVALFDLQRELKAELDTRIAIVQTLVRQADERIAELTTLQAGLSPEQSQQTMRRQRVFDLLRQGHDAEQIASIMKLSTDDVNRTIATLPQASNRSASS